MNGRQLQELQRKVDEAQSGFLVDVDPWRTIDELLDEVQLMRAILRYRHGQHPDPAEIVQLMEAG